MPSTPGCLQGTGKWDTGGCPNAPIQITHFISMNLWDPVNLPVHGLQGYWRPHSSSKRAKNSPLIRFRFA